MVKKVALLQWSVKGCCYEVIRIRPGKSRGWYCERDGKRFISVSLWRE